MKAKTENSLKRVYARGAEDGRNAQPPVKVGKKKRKTLHFSTKMPHFLFPLPSFRRSVDCTRRARRRNAVKGCRPFHHLGRPLVFHSQGMRGRVFFLRDKPPTFRCFFSTFAKTQCAPAFGAYSPQQIPVHHDYFSKSPPAKSLPINARKTKTSTRFSTSIPWQKATPW